MITDLKIGKGSGTPNAIVIGNAPEISVYLSLCNNWSVNSRIRCVSRKLRRPLPSVPPHPSLATVNIPRNATLFPVVVESSEAYPTPSHSALGDKQWPAEGNGMKRS